MVVYATEPQLQ